MIVQASRSRVFPPVPVAGRRVYVGMGDTAAIVQRSNQVLQSSGAIISGLALGHVGWATAAIPIVGPVIAGVTIALSMLANRKGPQQKTYTTKVVNEVEPHLKNNLDGYLSGPRTRSSQIQALANFDAGWELVTKECGRPELGKPGRACIDDRSAGACVWRDGAGECFNWFAAYRDPIANDPAVQADAVGAETIGGSAIDAAAGVVGDLLTSSSALFWPLLLVGAALVVANAD